MLLKDIKLPFINKIKVYAFVGPSGTGKSYRAQMVASEKNISYIIDDGLLVNENEVVAGESAKKAPTKIETVKHAIFIDEKERKEMIKAIKKFKPVEHRIEFVREIDGVKWYNDSASSSPTRTISGLNAFKENIILIAGGYDKNLEYQPLAKPVVDKVSTLILIGQTAEKIYDVVKNESEKENKKINIYMCDTLEQTIEIAKKSAKKGDVVLFSPASASFDMFKNFADRGHKFKDLVNKI